MKQHGRIITLGLLAAALVAGSAGASGFSIFEQSAKASGMAGAWVALADDAAANWYNPAALVWLEESQFQAGINAITVGGETELTADDPNFGIFAPTRFEPESSIETPVHVYYSHAVSPNFSWGIGLNNPFGLVSEWSDQPITFSARKAELVTWVLNPNFAFRLSETWSVAVGVDYMFADIKSFSRDVPIDLDLDPTTFEIVGRSNLSGDGDDIGFNLALHHRGDPWRFGLTYRSELSPEIDGTATFRDFESLAPFFPDGPGTATLDLPEQAAIAIAWDAGGAWAWETNLAFAGWSSFQEIVIDFQNEVPGFVEDVTLREDWDDTFSYRLGFVYRSSDRNTWRFGGLFDESPVPPETLRPSIPDADRWSLTGGWGRSGGRVDWDLYYMALWLDSITAVAGEEGVIAGEYESFAHLAGVTVTFGW